jgi:hypothetical protein
MAWNLLLNSDYGLLSLFVIVFCVIMTVFLVRFFSKKMDEKPEQ